MEGVLNIYVKRDISLGYVEGINAQFVISLNVEGNSDFIIVKFKD